MLRALLRMEQPFYIARHEEAPLLLEREAFLEHLLRQGTSLAAARIVVMAIAERYPVTETDSIARCVDRRNRSGGQEVDTRTALESKHPILQAHRELLHLCCEEVAALCRRTQAASDSAHAVRRQDRRLCEVDD